jgi:cyclophilin family peptidyl-prolyl cis-trans isomerase
MPRFARTLWESLRRHISSRPGPRKPRRPARRRLELEGLETRTLPASLTAVAFVDANHNGTFDAGELAVTFVPVTLTGKTTTGTNVSQTLTSDGNGSVTFIQLAAGTYQVDFNSVPGFTGSGVISGIKLTASQDASVQVAFDGLSADFLTQRQFLNDSTGAAFRFQGPNVSAAISGVTLTAGSSQTIDLAGHFSDPTITNSLATIQTNAGPINIQLFDSLTPQAVANFYNYLQSGRYNNTFFHRHATQSKDGLQVLQAGGFTAVTNKSGVTSLPAITTDPTIQNEYNLANFPGTLATAKLSGNANSASSQFFFNLVDNAKTLAPPNNGGFTVFGQVLTAADTTVLNTLAAIPIHDESQVAPTATNGVFNELPINNYTDNNAGFQGNVKQSDLALISSMAIVSRPNFLTYSVVSNSNPATASVSIVNERLTVTALATGTTNITVQASDQGGSTTTTTFTVTVL